MNKEEKGRSLKDRINLTYLTIFFISLVIMYFGHLRIQGGGEYAEFEFNLNSLVKVFD